MDETSRRSIQHICPKATLGTKSGRPDSIRKADFYAEVLFAKSLKLSTSLAKIIVCFIHGRRASRCNTRCCLPMPSMLV
jgi:hypothetical protein